MSFSVLKNLLMNSQH